MYLASYEVNIYLWLQYLYQKKEAKGQVSIKLTHRAERELNRHVLKHFTRVCSYNVR